MSEEMHDERPLFSVVVPCYNRSCEVLATLESVQRQTLPDFECVVVDDGSTDAEKLRLAVESLRDERFKYVYQENQGGGAARNTGIMTARGRFIAFLDSDDRFMPHKLASVKEFIEATGASAIYSKAAVDRGVQTKFWIKPERPIVDGEDMGEYLFVSNQVIQTSTIVVTDTVARKVMFDPRLRKGQDLDFCIRAHAMGVRFEMIDEPLILWTDATEVGRTSRHSGADVLLVWLATHQGILTRRGAIGFRATVVAVFRPKRQIGIVLWDFLLAAIVARVPLKVLLRQFLRFLLPRRIYRDAVDRYVNIRGMATTAVSGDGGVH